MESVSSANLNSAEQATKKGLVTVVESPVIGKQKAQRITTTCKSEETGQIISVLVEEFHNGKIYCRQFDEFEPLRKTIKECFDPDESLISSETERHETSGKLTKIIVRGSGKSSTTRIICAEVEARATERSIIIETPRASYSFQPFDGKWSSFYKDMNLQLELKSNYLKNPDSFLDGPDGIKLIFQAGRLVDLILGGDYSAPSSTNSAQGLVEP